MPFVFDVRVLGEVAQDEHDLVLHVERRVAVVAEVLRSRARRCRSRRRPPAPVTSPLSENDSACTSRGPGLKAGDPLEAVLVSAIVEPPSRVPAVNSNGSRKSVWPGSGFAPMRRSSTAMYSLASRSPFDPTSRPSKRSEDSVVTWARVFDARRLSSGSGGERRGDPQDVDARTCGPRDSRRHFVLLGFLGGALRSASSALS